MNRWRKIATAPKDGSWVIVFAPDLEMKVTIASYYREDVRNEETGRFIGGGWTGADYDGMLTAHLSPTDWMPLPDPPSEYTEAKG